MVLYRKTTLIVTALLLGIFFIVSFQPIITGNVIYSWDKFDLSSYPYPFIKNNYYNDVYIVVPASYSSDEIFAAYDVAYGLKGLRSGLAPIITTDKVPENAHNLILIGTPCSNTLTANFFQTADCTDMENKGVVSLKVYDRKSVMAVSGSTDNDVRKAALFLRNYDIYMPAGNLAFVEGSVNNPLGFTVSYR